MCFEFEMLLKSVQTRCTANVSRKCVPGTWSRGPATDSARPIAHPCPRPRDVKGEAVGRAKM